MAWVLPVATLIGGALSGALGKTNKETSGQTGTNTFGQQTMPSFGGFSTLADLVGSTLKSRLNAPLPAGYESKGLAGINTSYRGAGMNLSNDLASRGLSGSPAAAGAVANLQQSRAGAQGSFIAGEPIVERQMQDQSLDRTLELLGLARGSTSTGTSTGTGAGAGTQVLGGGLGGATGGLGALLAQMYANQQLNQQAPALGGNSSTPAAGIPGGALPGFTPGAPGLPLYNWLPSGPGPDLSGAGQG